MRWRTIKKPLVVVSRGMMRFNNEDERLANASFLFFFFFSLELVRPRGVVVVQFVQFRFKYRSFCVSFLSGCQLSGRCSQKKWKTREIFLSTVLVEERGAFCAFWAEKSSLWLSFWLFCRKRERERVGTKNTLIKSLEERKKELLIERTKRNARTTRKRRKRKRKRRTKRFLRFL